MPLVDFREDLTRALGRTIKKLAQRHPGMSIADVATALGVVAGAAVAEVVPAGHPDMDIELGNLIGHAYAMGVATGRKNKAS